MVERLLGILVRVGDALIIYFILSEPTNPILGIIKSFVFVTPLYILYCAVFVKLNDYFVSRGYDITGIEELREIADNPQSNFQKMISWTMSSKSTIFWVGSWFYLDPDYVTLLIRDKEKGFVQTMKTITIPSVAVSMIVWVPIYFLACKGLAWAIWLVK